MPTAEAARSTVDLDPNLHQALRLKSAQSHRSVSEIVNDALRQALREDQEDLAAARAQQGQSAGLQGIPRQAQRRWHARSCASNLR
jgi:plasmid stability protein